MVCKWRGGESGCGGRVMGDVKLFVQTKEVERKEKKEKKTLKPPTAWVCQVTKLPASPELCSDQSISFLHLFLTCKPGY